jgi:hypothetical protein
LVMSASGFWCPSPLLPVLPVLPAGRCGDEIPCDCPTVAARSHPRALGRQSNTVRIPVERLPSTTILHTRLFVHSRSLCHSCMQHPHCGSAALRKKFLPRGETSHGVQLCAERDAGRLQQACCTTQPPATEQVSSLHYNFADIASTHYQLRDTAPFCNSCDAQKRGAWAPTGGGGGLETAVHFCGVFIFRKNEVQDRGKHARLLHPTHWGRAPSGIWLRQNQEPAAMRDGPPFACIPETVAPERASKSLHNLCANIYHDFNLRDCVITSGVHKPSESPRDPYSRSEPSM